MTRTSVRMCARRSALAAAVAVCALAGAGACISTTDNSRPAADATGVWSYTGTQVAPSSADLIGVVAVTAQDGELIVGSATWEESSSGGMVTTIGGSLSGRVIGTADIDFDVQLPSGMRRHVARLTADTIRGSWVQTPGGATGQFTAVREAQ